jgi:hypothetical protein
MTYKNGTTTKEVVSTTAPLDPTNATEPHHHTGRTGH